MNVFLAFHDGDAGTASNMLAWLNQIGGMTGVDLYFVVDPDTDSGLVMCAKQVGKPKAMFFLDRPVKGWIAGSNALWLKAAEEAGRTGAPWLFLEPDAVPMRPTWAVEIENEYKRIGKPYMGAIVSHKNAFQPNPYMEGCAVYPASAFEELKAIVKPDKSWTLSTASVVVPKASNSELFQHLWGEKENPPTFARNAIPGTNVFALSYVLPKTALFHRSKDGSLIALLRQILRLDKSSLASDKRHIVLRRTSAIGDVLCATVVAERLVTLGNKVTIQCSPDIHAVIRKHGARFQLAPAVGQCTVNLDGAYENDPSRKNKHFHKMFFQVAQRQLGQLGINLGEPFNCTPRLTANPRTAKLISHPHPWVLIVPRSNNWANRTVKDQTWMQVASQIKGTCFWAGNNDAPRNIVDLRIRDLDELTETIAAMHMVITVDTGPMHIAAALNVPLVVVNQSSFAEHHLSNQNDFITVAPNLQCLDCQAARCHINQHEPPCQNISPAVVAEIANRRLRKGLISAIVSVYRPRLQQLNRCLTAALPQVDEIIVCRDLAGSFPDGALKDPKIRYVIAPESDIGYGRKTNFAVRHSSNEFLWMLNDDCYAQADTVAKMLEVMGPQIGMVAHELRYPNGLIQHGGTYRNPGDIGWGHLDHNGQTSRIKAPMEMENVTGASVLMRRKAFYMANGFDEDFYLYCEDNAMCLQIRKAGWKIMYTPHARAIHDEHQSSRMTPNVHNIMIRSQALLKQKWGVYFTHNANRIPGDFSY